MAILKNYFLNSSLHGLHFIADERYHWTERLFWALCVVGSWGASLWLMLNAIEQYQSQQISFSIDTSYLTWRTNFPSIVICETGSSKIDEGDKKLFGDTPLHLPTPQYFVYYDGTMRFKASCSVGGLLRNKCLLGNYSAYMHMYRSSCSEAIASCYYNGEEFPCCDEFMPIETYHGPCFAFNSLTSGKYNTRDELPFKIDREIDYGYGNLSIELLHANFLIYGLSQDAVPAKDSSKKYLLLNYLTPNHYYKAFLSVEETFAGEDARLMSIENRGCRFDDENDLQHSKIYSTSSCENECLVEAQRQICNCTVHTLPHNEHVKECDYDGLLCVISNDAIVQKSKTCRCITTCFDVGINIIGFTKTADKNLEDRTHIDFIVQAPTIRFGISVVKDALYILVSIGGTAGLFIGASLLTIVEVIYYIVIRPIGGKYLDWRKTAAVQKCKHNEISNFDNCYFEYAN